MTASLVDSLRLGTKGAAYDGTLIGKRDWGFKLEDITFPEIYIWHGELDKDIPVTQVQNIAERLSHCKTKYYPMDGHISTIVNHQEEIVKALMSVSA